MVIQVVSENLGQKLGEMDLDDMIPEDFCRVIFKPLRFNLLRAMRRFYSYWQPSMTTLRQTVTQKQSSRKASMIFSTASKTRMKKPAKKTPFKASKISSGRQAKKRNEITLSATANQNAVVLPPISLKTQELINLNQLSANRITSKSKIISWRLGVWSFRLETQQEVEAIMDSDIQRKSSWGSPLFWKCQN